MFCGGGGSVMLGENESMEGGWRLGGRKGVANYTIRSTLCRAVVCARQTCMYGSLYSLCLGRGGPGGSVASDGRIGHKTRQIGASECHVSWNFWERGAHKLLSGVSPSFFFLIVGLQLRVELFGGAHCALPRGFFFCDSLHAWAFLIIILQKNSS